MSLIQKIAGNFIPKKCFKKSAFTLAEVLITLGIIGTVAAMTIPNLIANTQSKRSSAILKQDYSVLSQILIQANEEGAIGSLPKLNDMGAMKQWFEDFFLPFMHPLQICYDEAGCWAPEVKMLNGSNPAGGHSEKGCGGYTISWYMQNGSVVCMDDWSAEDMYNIFGVKIGATGSNLMFFVDTNGQSPPNIYGKDIFIFVFDPSRPALFPAGSSKSEAEIEADCGIGGKGIWCAQKARAAGWNVKTF